MSLKSAKVKRLKTAPNYKDGNTVNNVCEGGPKNGKRQGLNKITLDNNLFHECNFKSKDNNNFFQNKMTVPNRFFLR
jgi:hypothetical protein